MNKPHYIIRRVRDNRLIAGVLTDVRSLAMAERIILKWQAINPAETFRVETV